MSEHVHDIELSWIPGVEPRTVTLRHSHATHPEEPHRHRWQVNLHADPAETLPKVTA